MATSLVFSQSTLTPTEGETVSLVLSGATAIGSNVGSPANVSALWTSGPNEGKYEDYSHTFNDWAYYKNTPFEAGDPVDEGIKLDSGDNGVVTTYSGHRQSHVSIWWRNLNIHQFTSISAPYDGPANFPIRDQEEFVVGDQANIKLEVVDPIVEPEYTHTEIVSIENNGFWEAGKSYDVVVNEAEDYSGYFAGYQSQRYTGLIGIGGTSVAGFYFNDKKGLINQTGIDTLFDSERVYGSTFYRAFADLVNAAVTAGIIDSVSAISSTQIENTTGDPDTDLWYERNTYRRTYRFAVSSTAPAGVNYLVFTSFKDDTVEEFSSGDVTQTYAPVLQVSAFPVRVGIAPPPVPERPLDYDEDAVWDPVTGGWTTDLADLTTLGGGRYGKQIVVVNNKGNIFFGDL